ncbi:MAG: electron transfer flavoprotein subunit beta/FixA family protein [Luteibaculaceae bacterium]
MKLLVCISRVPDTTAKISFIDDNKKFNEDKVQFIVNPYDEWYALVRALEITEANGGSVTIINVGGAENDPIIRKALAIGANEAVRINAQEEDAYTVASHIANYAKEGGFDIVFTGKETINYNGAQIGGMVAEMLDVPYISLATKLDLAGNVATLEKDIQGGTEVVEVSTPFVVSAAKGMAEQRIPNMKGIMAARTKPLKVVEPQEIAVLTEAVKFEMPAPKGDCKIIAADQVGELVELLHKEAKVI